MSATRIAAFGAAAACLTACLAACFDRLAGGGDATETGNARVSGVVRGEDGRGVVGAEVVLVPADFDPLAGAPWPDSLKAVTDDTGGYRFALPAAGRYNVLARLAANGTRLAVWGLRLGADAARVPDDTLRAPGSLSIPLPETGDSGTGWVYVPGTFLRVRIDSESRLAGKARLDSVPAGRVPALAYAKAAGAAPLVVARDVPVRPGAETQVDAYALWPYSRKLLLNTAEGATALARDLRDFPLLVRLAAPAFDFSQAAPDGSDLRFSAADGTPLPREIENWDAAAGTAAIWVRLDTLRAGQAGQSITMHWGPSPAAGPMRPRPVFDTAAGFAAVWHLGEEAADTSANGLYKDATGAGSDGDDRIASRSRAGVIGYGHGLDSGDYIVSPHPSDGLRISGSFTLSAWIRTDGKKDANTSQDLISMGDNYGLRLSTDSVLIVWYWPPKPPPAAQNPWYYLNAKAPGILDGRWHLATAVFDGLSLRLYCDGRELGSAPAADKVGLQFPLNATLGRHGKGQRGFEYAGDLDEVRVHSVARDSGWAKMEFENQKPGAGFPAFGP